MTGWMVAWVKLLGFTRDFSGDESRHG